MATQDERNRATRRALIDAARSLFAERGYAAVPVAEIAARAGVTTGALYHQFGSKQDVFRAVYSELVARVAERVVLARGEGAPTLLGDCEAFMATCSDPAFNRITIDGPVVLGWDEILDETQALIESSLQEARRRGEIVDLPIAPLARMLAAALKEAAVGIALAADPEAAREDARAIAATLIGGLLVAGPRV